MSLCSIRIEDLKSKEVRNLGNPSQKATIEHKVISHPNCLIADFVECQEYSIEVKIET